MSFSSTLLQWYAQHGRDLPWRRTRDPYAIWLSEIILQQTRIAQGEAYWHRFVERWPTVEQLAGATEDEVLRLWQGLGYYSRARNLHAAARQVVALGHFPTTYDDIIRLKGVGEYTAAAIASLAFDEPRAVVDGNVFRVLSRHFGIDVPINTTEGKKTFSALAQQLLPHEAAASYNQAIMDFGALQCTPQSPDCLRCPLLDTCDAAATGRQAQLPVKLRNLQVRERHLAYIHIVSRGRAAFHQRPAGDIWQGLWEPLLIEDMQALPPALADARLLRSQVKHQLTHRTLLADFYVLSTDVPPALPADFQWLTPEEVEARAKPRLGQHLLDIAAKHAADEAPTAD
jgi:A/G-specific adenine glycosylase